MTKAERKARHDAAVSLGRLARGVPKTMTKAALAQRKDAWKRSAEVRRARASKK